MSVSYVVDVDGGATSVAVVGGACGYYGDAVASIVGVVVDVRAIAVHVLSVA